MRNRPVKPLCPRSDGVFRHTKVFCNSGKAHSLVHARLVFFRGDKFLSRSALCCVVALVVTVPQHFLYVFVSVHKVLGQFNNFVPEAKTDNRIKQHQLFGIGFSIDFAFKARKEGEPISLIFHPQPPAYRTQARYMEHAHNTDTAFFHNSTYRP